MKQIAYGRVRRKMEGVFAGAFFRCMERHINIQTRLTEPPSIIKKTEQRNLNSTDIDLKSTAEIVQVFHEEDQKAVASSSSRIRGNRACY